MRTACDCLVLATVMLAGCATNLAPVRDFGAQTRALAEAFEPLLADSLEHCRSQVLDRRLYASEEPAVHFDPAAAWAQADDACRPLQQANAQARQLAAALDDYGRRLAELASDTLPRALNDEHDALATAWLALGEAPKARVDAVRALSRFLSQRALGASQREAIGQALAHEEAVGAIAETLATYAQRVHGGLLTQRLADLPPLSDAVRAQSGAPAGTRWQLMALHRQGLALRSQQQAAPRLQRAVAQLKASLRELRQDPARQDAAARWDALDTLAREIRALREVVGRGL